MSTSAPTRTKSITSAATHSLPNLAVSRSAAGLRQRRRPRPVPRTASSPEKGTTPSAASSRATSRKASASSTTTLAESRRWKRVKHLARTYPSPRPAAPPSTMDTGTPARAAGEKLPP